MEKSKENQMSLVGNEMKTKKEWKKPEMKSILNLRETSYHEGDGSDGGATGGNANS